jgi:YD repeat-containing protein
VYEQKLLHPEPIAIGAPAQAYHHQTDRHITYYPPNYEHWIIGQANEITTHTRFKTEPTLNASSSHSYYLQNENYFPLLKEVIVNPGNDPSDELVQKKQYLYDPLGNIASIEVSAPNAAGLPPRQTSFTYDQAYHYRFPTTQTNPAGYTSTFGYDQSFGWQTSSTDFNSLTSSYSNHPLGLQSGAVYPDGNRQMQALRWAAGHTDAPPDALYYSWSQSSGEPETLTFYHKTGKELRTVIIGFDGEKIYFDKIYNNRGLLWKESLPYHPGDTKYYTVYTYDDPGRVTQVEQPDNSSSTIQYNGNEVTSTNDLNQATTKKYNSAGWLTESIDPAGKSVKYDYFSDGNLKSAYIMGQPQTAVNMEYNSRRQRTVLTDPNYGSATYTYNAYDELITQITPREHTISYLYDILGRLETQTEPEGTTSWQYNDTPGKLGTLMSVSDGYHVTNYQYDGLLRLMAVDETIGTETYQTSYTYDHFGRMKNTAYPSGFEIEHIYNGYGFLHQIKSAKDNSLLWQTNETNTAGMIKGFQTGNGLQTTREFHPQTLRLENIHTVNPGQNTIQDLEFTWNTIGNLSNRKSWMNTPQNQNLVESFTYDNINRLSNITLNGVQKGAHQYDPDGLGNLIYKQASGQVLFEDAEYGEADYGPHAITSANTVPGVFPADNQQIVYNSYDKVTELSEGDKQLSITYGTHRQRVEQEYDWMFIQVKKRWAGACEYVTASGQQRIITYLSGPEGVFALHVIHPDASESIHYVHKDHLGSWHTITMKMATCFRN